MFIEIIKTILIGIVQGITEWLPVSSTGHMILLNDLLHLNVSDGFWEMFEVVIQLGAILAVIVLAIKGLLDLFLKTKLGYMLRATGNNESLVVSLGKDVGEYKILGLALANGIVAVSGALYANLYRQYDNTSGSGKVVLSLASVIIGLALGIRILRPLFRRRKSQKQDNSQNASKPTA